MDMKRILKWLILAPAALSALSCYEGYLNDYEAPNMGFSYPKQVRTIVADNPSCFVGVSIGGVRELTLNEKAYFAIDETLLSGLTYKILPGEYYTLSDQNTMRARRKTIFTADVELTFNDRFFGDAQSTRNTYALPLRIMGTSFPDQPDSTGNVHPNGSILKGGETAVIVFKYISAYSGTYYRMGSETEVDASGNVVGATVNYAEKDLISNPTTALATVSKFCVQAPGQGTKTTGALNLTVTEAPGATAYSVRVEAVKGAGEIVSNLSRYVLKGDYTFYSGDEVAPQFELDYIYKLSDRFYHVTEKLVLRQYPAKDLRLETFN